MNRAEVLLRRSLIVLVALVWATFFGITFQFSPLMIIGVALMSLCLAQFWDI